MPANTIPGLIENRVKEHGAKLLFQRRDGWSWKQITWLDFDGQVKNIAAYLMDLGLARGDTVIIASANRLEAISTEIAVYHLGGIIVPLCGGGSPLPFRDRDMVEEIVEMANRLEAKFVFVGRESLPALARPHENRGWDASGLFIRSLDNLPMVEKVIFFHNERVKNERITNFQTVLKYGMMRKRKILDELMEIPKNLNASLTALVFPMRNGIKRASQGDVIKALDSICQAPLSITTEDQAFSYMPSISPFSTLINYLTLYKGSMACTTESRKDFYRDILEVKPSIIFETREGIERIYERVQLGLNGQSPKKKLKKDVGGRAKYVFTDHPPSEQVQKVFRGAGIEFYVAQELNSLVS